MILLIDNYDSFTFNLYQLIRELGAECEVRRNDAITLDEIRAMRPEKIVISPGPGRPEDAGVSPDVIRTFAPTIPILGVCLGHQAIGLVLGGKVVRARVPMHGKCSRIKHDGCGVFSGLTSVGKGSAKSSAKGAKRGTTRGSKTGKMPGNMQVARYHSLVVERESLPDCLKITAETADGEIMGLRHREWPLEGVQFHPESIATEGGRELLRNFLCA